jgi:hypothetical protein
MFWISGRRDLSSCPKENLPKKEIPTITPRFITIAVLILVGISYLLK